MMRILLIILMFGLNLYPCWAQTPAKKAVKKGNLLYNEGSFEEALKNYEEAFVDIPESDIVNFNLGAALYKTEDYRAAIGHFEKSLVSEEESLEQKASYNIGNAKYKFGAGFEETDLAQAIDLLKEALRHYEHALVLEPEDKDAKYNYDFVKKELERLQKKLEQQTQAQKEKKDGGGQQQEGAEADGEEQKQAQQPESAKEEQKQTEDVSPQEQKKLEEQASGQTAGAEQPEEMSEEEAAMLLESYSQEEEPRGLYKEKAPTFGLPDVLKDW